MKKSIKFGGRKKFDEGGVARSSDGELIRFGYEDDDEYQKRVNADKAAQGRKKDVEFSGRTTTRKAVEDAIDATDEYNAGLKINQVKPPPAPLPSRLKTEDTDEADRRREEIGKLPQKTRGSSKSTNASEAPGSTDVERPYGAFRGNRSDTETDASKRSRGAFRGIRNDSAKDAENKKRGAFRGTRSDSASEMNKRGAFRGTRSDMSQDYFAKGGSVGSASKRADGIAMRGKTRGKIC